MSTPSSDAVWRRRQIAATVQAAHWPQLDSRAAAAHPPADAGRSSSGVRGDGLTARFYRTVSVAPAPQVRALAAAALSRAGC